MRKATDKERIENILEDCTLPENMFVNLTEKDDRFILQVGAYRKDTYTGEMGEGYGGKVYVSNRATDDEIVKKLLGLTLAYVEHEAREAFKYQGIRVFGPHISLEALMAAAPKTTYRKSS